jgi:spermidine synthase
MRGPLPLVVALFAAGAAAMLFAIVAPGVPWILAVAAIMVVLTLPRAVRGLERTGTPRALSILFAAAAFGAALAAMIGERYLIGALGLRGTALVAVALGGIAAVLVRRSPVPPAAAERAPWNVRLFIAALGTAALAAALHVVSFRLLLLYAPATDATFARLLMAALAGMALGALCAPWLARLGCAWLAAASALAVALGYLLASVVPAAILCGALFTALGSMLTVGRLVAAGVLGGGIGAALGANVLLPSLGIENSLFLIAAGYVAVSLLLVERWASRRALPAALGLALLLLFPFGRMERHLQHATAIYRAAEGSVVAQVIQGRTTTLQVLRVDRFGEPAGWRLVGGADSLSGIDRDSLRSAQFFAWLPLALHPGPRRALVVGYGAGTTARALLDDRGMELVTIAERSAEIIAAGRLIHGSGDPLGDPRVRLVVEDARGFLRAGEERFDVITARPPPAASAGTAHLYSREHFAALAHRLAPGGLATCVLPVSELHPRGARSVVAAFCDAFPDCSLWAGTQYEWILLGGREFRHRPTVGGFARLWDNPFSAARMEASGFDHPAQIGAAFLADAEQLRRWTDDAAPVTDDRPGRIAAGIPAGEEVGEYRRLLDPQAAAADFRGSRWIAEHFPGELAGAALEFFAVQPILNGAIPAQAPQRLELLDALLRHTRLTTPVLWVLGSDMIEQRIIDRARIASGGQPEPVHLYPLGALWLSKGDYAQAARLLAEAAEQDPQRAGPVAAYSACRAGQAEKAKSVKGAELLPAALRCWN